MYLWLGEFIISLIAALIAIFFFVDAGTFQDLSTNPLDIGSRAFPRLVCIFLFIFAVYQMIHAIKKTKPLNEKVDLGDFHTIAIGAVILAVYIYAFKAIGYFYTTPFFIFILQLIQGSRKWVTMIAVSIGFSLFAYLVFVRFLGVALP